MSFLAASHVLINPFEKCSFNEGSLAIRFNEVVENACYKYKYPALIQIKKFAHAYRTYIESGHNLFAELDGPISTTVGKVFTAALGETGVFWSIRAIEKSILISHNIEKRKALEGVIGLSQLALSLVSCKLLRTPSCPDSIVSVDTNPYPFKYRYRSSEMTS
jgi:hypothetical protein